MGIQPISAWRQLENWRLAQSQFNAQALSNQDLLNSALADAMTSFYTGLTTLAGQAALKRVQTAAKAKAAEASAAADKALASLPTTAGATTGTKINTTA